MEGISDIKICGIDPTRPPRILKAPYINLYFELVHKAPADWCADFNHLVSKKKYTSKIDPVKGLHIETWVRKPEEIEIVLNELKQAVSACNQAYIDRIRAEAGDKSSSTDLAEEGGEQGRAPNKIIAALDYETET